MDCKKCNGRIVLWAFSEFDCELCGKQMQCSFTPPNKICDVCAEENDFCEFCGEDLDYEKE